MASGKKNAKGNKTAHVLNLLTAPGSAKEGAAPAGEEPAAEGAAPEGAAPGAPASSRPLLPPILEVAQANDESLAQQIQQALEEELQPEEPVKDLAPAPEPVEEFIPFEPAPEPAEEPAPAPEPPAPASGGKMSQDEIERLLAAAQEPAEEPAPAPEPPVPEPPKDNSQPSLADTSEDITYINIMQALVEEKAPGYIKKFGLCSCKHCEADVKALALSNLVPKYVVLSRLDRIPMLTVYEGRYNSTIFAQLTRACKTVMDHPHHNRSM